MKHPPFWHVPWVMFLPPQFQQVADTPDEFLELLYRHKHENGFRAGLIHRVADLVALAAVTVLAVAVIGFVRWGDLAGCRAASPTLSCGNLGDYLDAVTAPWTLRKIIALLQFACLAAWWVVCLLALVEFVGTGRRVREFCSTVLQLSDNKIATEPWSVIVRKLCGADAFLDVQMRLLRKDNFWVAIYSSGMFNEWQLKHFNVLDTTVFHAIMNFCVVGHTASQEFIRSGKFPKPSLVRRRLCVMATLILVLLPCVGPFLCVYYLFRHAEEMRSAHIQTRMFSFGARWLIREFNETTDSLEWRLARAEEHTTKYLGCFANPVWQAVASKIVMVAGFALGILIFVALFDEGMLLSVALFNHHLLWYMGALTLVIAAARHSAPTSPKNVERDAAEAFEKMYKELHYSKHYWFNNEHTHAVRDEVLLLYPYKAFLFVRELAAMVIVPCYLLYWATSARLLAVFSRLEQVTCLAGDAGHVCWFSCMRAAGDPVHQQFDDLGLGLEPATDITPLMSKKMQQSMVYLQNSLDENEM